MKKSRVETTEQEIEEMDINKLKVVRDADVEKLQSIRTFICKMGKNRRGAKKGGWEVYWEFVRQIAQSYVDFLNKGDFLFGNPDPISHFYDFFTGHRICDSYQITKYMYVQLCRIMNDMEKKPTNENFATRAERYVYLQKIRNTLLRFIGEYEERVRMGVWDKCSIMKKPEGVRNPMFLIPSVTPAAKQSKGT